MTVLMRRKGSGRADGAARHLRCGCCEDGPEIGGEMGERVWRMWRMTGVHTQTLWDCAALAADAYVAALVAADFVVDNTLQSWGAYSIQDPLSQDILKKRVGRRVHCLHLYVPADEIEAASAVEKGQDEGERY